ncbi:MAG: Spy/CpxP family protein refolding chaperone [Fibrobacterota bacterium]
MTLKQFLISGVVILFAGTQIVAKGPANTRGCHAKKGAKQYRMIQELDLTEQQQEQIKQLHEEMKQTRRDHWTNVKEVRRQIREELQKENPDQTDLDQYAERNGELAKLFSQKRSTHILQIKNILTDEQFQKMMELKDSRKYRQKNRRYQKCPKEGKVQ